VTFYSGSEADVIRKLDDNVNTIMPTDATGTIHDGPRFAKLQGLGNYY